MVGRPVSAFLFILCALCIVSWSPRGLDIRGALHTPADQKARPVTPSIAKITARIDPSSLDFTPTSRIGKEDDQTQRPGADLFRRWQPRRPMPALIFPACWPPRRFIRRGISPAAMR